MEVSIGPIGPAWLRIGENQKAREDVPRAAGFNRTDLPLQLQPRPRPQPQPVSGRAGRAGAAGQREVQRRTGGRGTPGRLGAGRPRAALGSHRQLNSADARPRPGRSPRAGPRPVRQRCDDCRGDRLSRIVQAQPAPQRGGAAARQRGSAAAPRRGQPLHTDAAISANSSSRARRAMRGPRAAHRVAAANSSSFPLRLQLVIARGRWADGQMGAMEGRRVGFAPSSIYCAAFAGSG
jgi:hypothetical protein